MKSADAFDGNDVAFAKQKCGGFYRCFFIDKRAIFVSQPNLRTTDGTGVRLCMKAPVGWIFIFLGTVGTQRKIGHRGVFAIIGNGFNNGKARAAMSAVGERVVIATVSWIK